MKILIICNRFWPPEVKNRGIGSVFQLVREISRRKIEVHVLTALEKIADKDVFLWFKEENQKYKIVFHVIDLRWFPFSGPLHHGLSKFVYLCAAVKLHFKFKFDIINEFSESPLFFFPNVVYKLLGVRTIHTICTNSVWNFLSVPLVWRVGQILDKVVVTSRLVEKKLLAVGFPKNKLTYLSFGVNLKKFKPKEKKNDKVRIVYVGKEDVKRGSDLFFDAAKKIKGPEFIWVASAANFSPPKINLIKGTKNIAKIFTKVEIVVLPYRSLEGILFEPQTLLEAMASGLAVLIPNFPILREITDGSVIYYQPKRTTDFLSKLKKLIKDRNLRSILGKKARKIVEERFDVNDSIRRLIKVYQGN